MFTNFVMKLKQLPMKKLLIVLLIPMLASGLILNGQKISVQSGKVGVVKGQKMLATFDYSGMAVGKFDKEDDYIAEKSAEYNKKEAGKATNGPIHGEATGLPAMSRNLRNCSTSMAKKPV